MKIHETTESDGSFSGVELALQDGGLVLSFKGEDLALPEGALKAVMTRYGAELDPASRVRNVASMSVGEGCTLRHIRHIDVYDVIARDWLVFEAPSAVPICALANVVGGALQHLARAARTAG